VPNIAELVLVVTGKDQTGGMLSGLGGKARAVGTAVGAAGVAAGAGLLKIGNDYNGMADNIAAGTGATGEALDSLNATAIDVFRSMPVSMEDAGTSIADLNTRLGLTGKPLEETAKAFLDYSRIAGTDVAGAVKDVTRVMGDWGVAAEDSAIVLDKIFVGAQNTGISVESLSQKVVQFGAPLRGMGFSLEESIAMLGKWEKEGVNSELVLGSFRTAMGKFAREGVDMKDGLADTIAKIQEFGAGAEATGLAMEIFGARAGPDMAAAILEGRFELGDMVAAIEGAEGKIDTTAEAMDDWRESLKIYKNNLLGFVAPHADLAGGILSVGGSAAMMGANITRVVPAIASMGPALQTAAVGARAVGMALLTPPLGIIIALVAVGVAAYVFRDEIIAAFKAVWEFIEPTVTLVSEAILGAFNAVLDFGKEHWPEIVTLISGPFFPIVALATDAFGVRSALTGAFQWAKDWVSNNWPIIAAIISGPFAPLVLLATDAFGIRSAMTDAISGLVSTIATKIGELVGYFTRLPGRIVSALGDVGGKLWQKGKDLIAGFVRGMTSVSIPNPLDMVPGGGLVSSGAGFVGGLFRHAGGEVGAGQPYVVGERGPEWFVPRTSGTVLPSGVSPLVGGGLALNLYGPINVQNIGEQRDVREVLADLAFGTRAQLRSRGVMV
jgi:hypothetical protein